MLLIDIVCADSRWKFVEFLLLLHKFPSYHGDSRWWQKSWHKKTPAQYLLKVTFVMKEEGSASFNHRQGELFYWIVVQGVK